MTAPGQETPAQPGWWPKVDRVGVALEQGYGWEFSIEGSTYPVGGDAGEYGYGWDSYAIGEA